MAIKPGLGRKTNSKNPPFFSHEFVIVNHADIVSCVAMVFVVGLMVQATSTLASTFIALHHNVTGADPSHENPRGELYTYESGWKDWCAVFFYTLICIIMHAILQEYVIDKISKKLHLSKFKQSRFDDSCQLFVFYAMSLVWGADVILREGYASKFSLLYDDYPQHPMIFLHKLFYIIQLAYYLHMLPELYFQKVKKEDQQSKIIQAITSFSFIAIAYVLAFHRISLVLLTVHYFSETIYHVFNVIRILDRDEKFSSLNFINDAIFILARFATVVLTVLTLYFGLDYEAPIGIFATVAIIGLQMYLIVQFFADKFRTNREWQAEQKQLKKKTNSSKVTAKKDKKRESDLPEADQNIKINDKKSK